MRTILIIALAAAALVTPATASDADDIRARLENWVQSFNEGRKEAVCDLFSREIIAKFRGQPERTYDDICALLHDSIDDPSRDYRYQLKIDEIIVEGDLAVVRLTRAFRASPPGVTSIEPGLDVLRREADNKWRIIRYLAYEAP